MNKTRIAGIITDRQCALIACCLSAVLFFAPARMYAQASGAGSSQNSAPPSSAKSQAAPLMDRLSFRTNAIDWLATIPNVTVGFDLFPGQYNNQSILAGIKWNWDTYHQQPAYYVFNTFDLRAEYRWHFRHTQLPKDQQEKFFSLERKNPRPWQARYIGGYVNAGSFSLKPSTTGRQGWQVGVGVSAGMELPLYQYKTGAVDVDLGASAGLSVSKYNLYTLNEGHSAYVMGSSRFMILPVVAELRAALSWRKVSVKEKYLQPDPEKAIYRQALEDLKQDFENTTKQTFDESRTKAQERLYAQSDSAYVADFKAWLKENVEDEKAKMREVPVTPAHRKKLLKKVDRLAHHVDYLFMYEQKQKQRSANKELKAAKAEETKARKEAEKEAKASEKAAKAQADEATAKADNKAEDKEALKAAKAAEKAAKAEARKAEKEKAKAEKEKAKAEKAAKKNSKQQEGEN